MGGWIEVGRYLRADLRAHPSWLYLFGDNQEHRGSGGQAAEARGEPNAVGVPTKRAPGRSPGDYWSDADLERNIAAIEEALNRVEAAIRAGRTIVAPAAGLGTGLAMLPARAPQTFGHLTRRLDELRRLAEGEST
jgi:hypothetical protein